MPNVVQNIPLFLTLSKLDLSEMNVVDISVKMIHMSHRAQPLLLLRTKKKKSIPQAATSSDVTTEVYLAL